MIGLRWAVATLVVGVLWHPTTARAWFDGKLDVKGQVKLQSQVLFPPQQSESRALGVGNHLENMLRVRLMGNGQLGWGVSWDAAWQGDVRQGEGVKLERELRESEPDLYVPPERRQLLYLHYTLLSKDEWLIPQGIDRLSMAYTGEHLVVRLGRQALTWGDGLVFRPLDLFNPFAPTAPDTEYKPGADMLYAQWLFDSGADLQAVMVPRREPKSRELKVEQSSAGLKWRGFVGATQQLGYQIMLAHDYDANVVGVVVTGSLWGATWTVEVVPTLLPGAKQVRVSGLANGQYAWTLFSKNFTGYVEYFFNGFGMAGSHDTLADMSTALMDRLARGQLFTLRRDYVALGLRVELTPLVTLQALEIIDADDGSVLGMVQGTWSIVEDLNLTLAAQSGFGLRGTEYGGLELAPEQGTYYAPSRYLYARLDWYF